MSKLVARFLTTGPWAVVGASKDRSKFGNKVLLAYLEHGRAKCMATIAALTDESAAEWIDFPGGGGSRAELLLYHYRHVQHAVGQLNVFLRERIDSAPGWVARHPLASK